jgi:exosortase A-associated hydrolase 1
MTASARPATEEAFVFDCEGEALLGILHRPAPGAPGAAAQTGVVVIVGGPQYRAGSHRQFVHLARALAAAGHPVLRFDVRGMGDSSGVQRDFEHITPDVGAAIDALAERAPGLRRVVLWGLCDGASAALLYLHARRDARVQGLCLLNPWVRSEASLARTHVKHYYAQRLREPAFWKKLFSGQVAGRALRELGSNLRAARRAVPVDAESKPGYQARMAAALAHFDGATLLVLSGNDYTAREFDEYVSRSTDWQGLLGMPRVSRQDMPGADHTFSTAEHRETINATTLRWLRPLA